MLSPVNEHHNSFIHYEPRLTDIVTNEPIFIAEDAAHETDHNFRGLMRNTKLKDSLKGKYLQHT